MADYWKSQPRKFCQYCKCWIADNKPSIEFHERGKNHKENVAAKISEIKKKSVNKAKQEKKMGKQFAAMEEAAQRAYEEDLRRMERESRGIFTPAPPTKQPEVRTKTKTQERKDKKKLKELKKAAQFWVEGQSEDGHTYYYNTLTEESQWEKPAGFRGQNQMPPASVWVSAVSPDGCTYYYNPQTGQTSWEKTGGEPECSTAEEIKKDSENSEASEEIDPQQKENSDQTEDAEISSKKRPADEDLKEDRMCSGTKDEVQSAVKPEEKQARPVKRAKAANPYGAWEQIKEEPDPYAKVDLQLPQVEEIISSAPADLPPEPKQKFKERVITSIGTESGPASFRRKKTQSSKTRNLRQRDDDD